MALTFKDVRRLFQVPTRGNVRLRDYSPGWAADKHFQDLTRDELKARAAKFLMDKVADLTDAQERLYASDTHSVLIVLQASDAAGKDGTIKHVMSGVNPQGCQVLAFKKPSSEELDHNFLWRYMKALPERGRIGIFNRSYYEDVLVVRVHPELLSELPGKDRGDKFWRDRYDDINQFERHLARNGTLVLKFFLNVSKKEQRKRFMERLDKPEKNWKFSFGALEERKHWSDYQDAFEKMLQHTSTPWAPWWVIPADHKWVTRALVAEIITRSIDGLGVKFPAVSAERRRRLASARRALAKARAAAPSPKNSPVRTPAASPARICRENVMSLSQALVIHPSLRQLAGHPAKLAATESAEDTACFTDCRQPRATLLATHGERDRNIWLASSRAQPNRCTCRHEPGDVDVLLAGCVFVEYPQPLP